MRSSLKPAACILRMESLVRACWARRDVAEKAKRQKARVRRMDFKEKPPGNVAEPVPSAAPILDPMRQIPTQFFGQPVCNRNLTLRTGCCPARARCRGVVEASTLC